VYGGNDFSNALTLFHQYNGTTRPPGTMLYREAIDAVMAREDLKAPMAQAFSAYKYFDTHPDQMEVAAQVARDVTTEILVTCMRHSVHPVFVYIPSMADTEWDTMGAQFDELQGVLEVGPTGLESADRIADSYLAFLRERRVDVIDTTTDTIVDVDPDRPGIQAIELTGLRPSHRMHVDHEARRLYVSEPSLTFHPVEGGIDVIDLDSLRALGFVTTASSLLRTTCATAGRTTTSIPSNINKAHRDIVRRENVEQREIWSWDRVIRT